ncbi:MAG: SpoIVB peptidase S55 domain-containing protein, partial [Microlunatus sp.]
MAVSDIQPGMVGEGLTVVTGTEPQSFKVEVIGVIPDGIGAGRDMVMIEVSDLPNQNVIGANGIWAGMSGSPVYVDGKLLGAISYGFTWSASPIGGLTPASDMIDLLNAPNAGQAKAKGAAKDKVTLSASQRKAAETRATAAIPRSLEKLPTPVSVSGLSNKRLASLQKTFDKSGRSFIAYRGASAGKPVRSAAAPTAPVPGGNFAAVQIYGDLSVAGVGTTTAVCGNKVLAFGHPMDFAGKVSYGANHASSLQIINDQGNGSFKMANVGDNFGIVDQDRMAAIRATIGNGP